MKTTKILAAILAMCMLLTMGGVTSFADEIAEDVTEISENAEIEETEAEVIEEEVTEEIVIEEEVEETEEESLEAELFEAESASESPVAKVGNTEYATIGEALEAWTNGATLTLLADVTLPDVVTLNSTEHHILNLETYTLTAASGKNAFVIKACGTGSSERSCITINGNTDPEMGNIGTLNAGNKSCVYYKYADGKIS